MPTTTYTPLANLTLSSSAASVTFSSISQVYRDVVMVFAGSSASQADFYIRFNGDTGANYTRIFMQGDGTNTESFGNVNDTPLRISRARVWPGELTNVVMNLMDYSATDRHKTALIRANNSARATEAFGGRWASTAALTSITLLLESGVQFAAGSTFSLYGIVS